MKMLLEDDLQSKANSRAKIYFPGTKDRDRIMSSIKLRNIRELQRK